MRRKHPSLPLRLGTLGGILAASLGLAIAGWALPTPALPETAQANAAAAVSVDKSPETESGALVVREHNGMVCVYRDGILYYKTDIPVISLPEQNRKELSEGIKVANETEMHRLLEDFGA